MFVYIIVKQILAELKKQIEEIQASKRYLYDLVTQQDDRLVESVKYALGALGFVKVIDVDELYDQDDGNPNRDEDLRIDDSSPMLLVEIKGISGKPKDEDVLQVAKYLAPRMKELGRTDIKGLSIINHQRNLPLLDREKPFRELHIDNAEQREIGLMTTWTLCRLVQAFVQNGWTHDVVHDLFYQNGEIDRDKITSILEHGFDICKRNHGWLP